MADEGVHDAGAEVAGGVAVHRHASPGTGSVNTWLVEAPGGIVAVDAQRQLSQAAEVARAARTLGKPVAAILLTHPHPDHVGGLPALSAAFPGAAVAASERTAAVMRADEGGVLALARSYLGDDFAAGLPEPTHILPERGAVEFAGLRFTHAEVGPGETACATVFVVEGRGLAFVGDVAANGMTPWLVEGHSAAWLDQIGRVEALLPPGALAHPGHGAAAPAGALLAAQRDYIRRFRAGGVGRPIRPRGARGRGRRDRAALPRLAARRRRARRAGPQRRRGGPRTRPRRRLTRRSPRSGRPAPTRRPAVKILALLTPAAGKTPDDFRPHVVAEEAALWPMYREGLVREMHFQPEPLTVALTFEAAGKPDVEAALGRLPMVRAGLLDVRLVALGPWLPLEALFRDDAVPAAGSLAGHG